MCSGYVSLVGNKKKLNKETHAKNGNPLTDNPDDTALRHIFTIKKFEKKINQLKEKVDKTSNIEKL